MLALLLALALGFFVLGRGPGTLIWLSGSRLSWLPFVGAGLNWLPVPIEWLPVGAKASGIGGQPHPSASNGHGATPVPVTTGAASPGTGTTGSPTGTGAPSPTPTPLGHPSITPSSLPSGVPTGLPLATPTPIDLGVVPGVTPTPTPAPAATPIPTPTPAPSPTPAPTPTPFVPVTLFSDNFEANLVLPLLPSLPSGWTNEPAGLLGLGGYTTAVDGSKVLKGPAGSTGFPAAVAGSSTWTNYKVAADLKVDPTTGSGRIIARHQSAGNFYACGLDANQQLVMSKVVAGTWSTIAVNGYSFTGSTWYHIDLSVQGTNLTCLVTEPGSGHSRQLTATATNFAAGSIGASGEYAAEYDNFVVTSLP